MASLITLSMRDWLVRGELGPLSLGHTRDAVLASVGVPEKTAGEADELFRYGDVEVIFDDGGRVYCVSVHAFSGVPRGSQVLRVDPWIVRRELAPADLEHALRMEGATPRLRAEGEEVLHLSVDEVPGVYSEFLLGDTEYVSPKGLYGVYAIAR